VISPLLGTPMAVPDSSNKVGSSARHTHRLAGPHVHAEPNNSIRREMMKIRPEVAENGDNSSIKGEAKSSNE
jgi:hypothetical protein